MQTSVSETICQLRSTLPLGAGSADSKEAW